MAFHSLPPLVLAKQAVKVLSVPVLAYLHRSDRAYVAEATAKYRVGCRRRTGDPHQAWKDLQHKLKGFELLEITPAVAPENDVPFVLERSDAGYLRDFREKYRLEEVVHGAPDEYTAMLRLGAWLGDRWDHGSDPVPGGNLVSDPSAVVAAGEAGSKFWCEIAARITVHAATALGWTARVITASRDGYTWEHAIAELWCNQFGKWFVLDTDFNVVYEVDGKPLSAFELTHEGEELQRSGRLVVRPITAPKPSLPYEDMMPFYRYIHVDLRTDWCSRVLPRGSPAGGDLATWWTARPSMQRILTAKSRVDAASTFNWPVDTTALHLLGAHQGAGDPLRLEIGLSGYSTNFQAFEFRVDGAPWQTAPTCAVPFAFSSGRHCIETRLRTGAGYAGQPTRIVFQWTPPEVLAR